MAVTLRRTVEVDPPGYFVQLPEDVVQALGAGKRPAVKATIKGVEYLTRIAVYSGRYYLGLRREFREAADLTVGNEVEISLEVDSRR